MKRLFPVLAALLLAACGGSGNGSSGPEPAPPLPPPAMPGDAFTAALVILVRSAPDSAEPSEVDDALPPMPDGAEPFAIE